MKCDGEKGLSTNSEDSTERRLECPTAPKVLDLAVPRGAQFVMASLVSSGLLVANPALFQEVRRSLQNSQGK
jgi:hypothetical protein